MFKPAETVNLKEGGLASLMELFNQGAAYSWWISVYGRVGEDGKQKTIPFFFNLAVLRFGEHGKYAMYRMDQLLPSYGRVTKISGTHKLEITDGGLVLELRNASSHALIKSDRVLELETIVGGPKFSAKVVTPEYGFTMETIDETNTNHIAAVIVPVSWIDVYRGDRHWNGPVHLEFVHKAKIEMGKIGWNWWQEHKFEGYRHTEHTYATEVYTITDNGLWVPIDKRTVISRPEGIASAKNEFVKPEGFEVISEDRFYAPGITPRDRMVRLSKRILYVEDARPPESAREKIGCFASKLVLAPAALLALKQR